MEVLYIVIIVLISLIVFFFGIVLALARAVVKPRRYSMWLTKYIESKKGFFGNYDTIEKKEYLLKSYDDYLLHCVFVPAESDSNNYVIISHGQTYTRNGSVKYLHIFRELGFNVIIYDDRSHGENKRSYVSMGIRESQDLICLINDTYNKYGKDINLGLHGESMGTGLSIMSLKYNPKLKFIIADCGYADMEILLTDVLKSKHLPIFMLNLACKVANSLYGVDLLSIRPIDCLKESKVPICYIHGKKDKLVNCKHSQMMYDVTKGYKELHLIEKADHAQSYQVDKVAYKEIITRFLGNIQKGETNGKH
ncbi:MAG: alpha/beta hydrolase [Clostridia bacterium]